MYVCVDAIVCICVCFKECGSSILGPPFSCCLCPWREVRTCLHGQEGGGGSDGRLPVCCSPRFFLKDALSTKSCSKPTTCTKHSVSNHCVSSFGPHSQIVWAEGLATLNRLQEGEAGPVEPTYFLSGISLRALAPLPDKSAHQAFSLRGQLIRKGTDLTTASYHRIFSCKPETHRAN